MSMKRLQSTQIKTNTFKVNEEERRGHVFNTEEISQFKLS